MGMIELVKETNKMLADTTDRLQEVCTILAGPQRDKCDAAPATPPESLIDDVTFTHKQAMKLMDITAGIENVLKGGKCQESVGCYDPRYER